MALAVAAAVQIGGGALILSRSFHGLKPTAPPSAALAGDATP